MELSQLQLLTVTWNPGKKLVVRSEAGGMCGRMLTMAHDVMTDDGSSRVSIIKCLYFSFLGVCVQSK